MTFSVSITSCLDDLGNIKPASLIHDDTKAIIFSGDLIYSNMGTARLMRGVQWDPDIFWREGDANPPVNARSFQRLIDRFEIWNGPNGIPNWADFWSKTNAKGIPVYWQLDDHDLLGDNWDHTTSALAATFTYANLAAYGQIVQDANMTLADTLYTWRFRNQAKRYLFGKYFDNPVNTGFNGDVPAAMVGTASPADYDIDYFVLDYDEAGNLGGKCVRFILPDSLSYKSQLVATDDASKTFLGAKQTAWLKAKMLEARDQGFGQVVLVFTKDVFGTDNNDGMGASYTNWRDNQLLGFIEANNIPCCVVTGDKHLAHTSISRKDSGGITDLVVHCSSPCGSRHSALVQHKELVWSAPRADMAVYEKVTIDPDAKTVTLATMDVYTRQPLNVDVIPFGSRKSIDAMRVVLPTPRRALGFGRTAVTVTASPMTWQNPTGRPIAVTIPGGTLTSVEVSQDGTTYDNLGASQRQVVLQRGETMRLTYSAAPTMAYYPILREGE